MSYGLAWLQDQNALRCVLVEAVAQVAGVETTFYLSTRGYITEASESPANTNYVPCIVGDLQITETLPLDGTASIAYGDIEILNLDGSRDSWLDYVWANRSVKVYIGDVSWARADFQLIFDGILADIDSKSYDKLNLKVRDKLQRLNGPISETKLGTGDNPDALIPLTFGECCNITPLLSNPATPEYQVHAGPIEHIIEVRDNGVPLKLTITTGAISQALDATAKTITRASGSYIVDGFTIGDAIFITGYTNTENNITLTLSNVSALVLTYSNSINLITETASATIVRKGYTPYLATGKFTLEIAPVGTITCSIQGDKPSTYTDTVAAIVQRIVKDFGKVSSRFTAGDLDSTNLAAFEAANPQAVGIYVTDRENIITVIQNLATSVGAQPTITRAGKLALLRIELPPSGTPTVITETDIVLNSLAISDRLVVISSVKIGYCKNWTVQTELQTGIPEEHKNLFNKEYLTFTVSDYAVATNYMLDIDPIERDTYLLNMDDTIAEATRELNLYKVPRHIYSFTMFPQGLLLELGAAVTLTHRRFGLSAGKTGMIVSLQTDWIKSMVTVGVLI